MERETHIISLLCFSKAGLHRGWQRDWQYCSAVLVNHIERQDRELLSESGKHSRDISAFVPAAIRDIKVLLRRHRDL